MPTYLTPHFIALFTKAADCPWSTKLNCICIASGKNPVFEKRIFQDTWRVKSELWWTSLGFMLSSKRPAVSLSSWNPLYISSLFDLQTQSLDPLYLLHWFNTEIYISCLSNRSRASLLLAIWVFRPLSRFIIRSSAAVIVAQAMTMVMEPK